MKELNRASAGGAFRLAKRSGIKVLDVTDDSIMMELTDQKGQKVKRIIMLSDTLSVRDESEGNNLLSYVHLSDGFFVHAATGTSETYAYITRCSKKLQDSCINMLM